MKFTDNYIKNLKPTTSWYEKIESSGLGIRVMPSGNKSWIYRYTLNKKRQKITLGKYPSISLKKARELLFKAQSLKEQGISPIEDKKVQKNKAINTFGKLVDEWFHSYVLKNRKKPHHIKQQIDADIFPLLGHFELEKIKPIDITHALDKIVSRGARVHANRVLSSIKQVFNYGISRGSIEINPAMNIRSRNIGGIEKPRERFLSIEELNKVWVFLDTDACQMSLQTKTAIKLIILTGVRTAEIRLARWGDFDFKNSTWVIPADHTKSGITVKVHLTDLTKSVLTEVKEISDSPFVISGAAPTKPLGENALPRAIKRSQEKIGIPAWTAHDLRRTFATQLGETLDVDPVVIEKCLGHKMPRIMATYNKNEMLTQRKEALERWSNYLLKKLDLKMEERSY